MGRGGDNQVLLAPERRGRKGDLRDNFLENENDHLICDPKEQKAWMIDGQLTDEALGMDSAFVDKSRWAKEMFDEGLDPDLVGVIIDTAELFRFDIERREGKEPGEITPFADLTKESQEEWVLKARAAYIAVAKQAFARPLAEVDDPTLLTSQGYFAVDDTRKIKGTTFESVYDASSGDGKNHPVYLVPQKERDKKDPYMIMTDGKDWVPFDIDLAARDAQEVISDGDVAYEDLNNEEQEELDILIRDMIIVNKRPLKLVEGNAWHYRDAGDGGYVHKFIDPLNRIHNTSGPAIIHFNEDGQVTYERFFEDGREVRDGRPSAIHEDGSVEYWVGTWSEPSVDGSEDDFVVNVYRIDYSDGGQEWWSGDGICYRRVSSSGREVFDESFFLGEGFGYETTLQSSERKKIFSVLGYKPDEIEIILKETDGKKLVEKLQFYRRSDQYREARQEEEKRREEKRGEEEIIKKEPRRIDNLLFPES